jgi:MYXO-CTERM domain-containing protein
LPYRVKHIEHLSPSAVAEVPRAQPRGWIAAVARAVGGAVVLATLAACGAPAEATELEIGTRAQAIYEGTVDDDDRASDGVVSLKIGNGTSFELCSGSLLSSNVVLTARHCVSKAVTSHVSCNEIGESGNGDHVGEDESLEKLHVYSGSKPAYGGAASAGVKKVIHPEGGILCNADVALLVLDRAITDVAPLRIRLASTPHPDETVRAVGYGQNDRAVPVGTRLRKDAVKVLAVGQRVSASRTPLGSHEFEVGLSICAGDSGGPAISEATGAVIGVVSRGGDCTDDFGHIYTATAGYADLVAQAFALAGGTPLAEQSDPQATDSPTPTSHDTTPVATSASAQGCSASPASPDPSLFSYLTLLALARSAVRRRRLNARRPT